MYASMCMLAHILMLDLSEQQRTKGGYKMCSFHDWAFCLKQMSIVRSHFWDDVPTVVVTTLIKGVNLFNSWKHLTAIIMISLLFIVFNYCLIVL